MRIIRILIVILSISWLTGCGIAQSVSDTAAGLSQSVFNWSIKTLYLDIKARSELNLDDEGRSSPVVLRVYQLTNAEKFNSATYTELVDQDSDVLKDTLIETKEIILRPDRSISIDTPLDKKATAVGVIGLFKEPNLKNGSWKLTLTRKDLHISKPREIIASKYSLKMQDEK